MHHHFERFVEARGRILPLNCNLNMLLLFDGLLKASCGQVSISTPFGSIGKVTQNLHPCGDLSLAPQERNMPESSMWSSGPMLNVIGGSSSSRRQFRSLWNLYKRTLLVDPNNLSPERASFHCGSATYLNREIEILQAPDSSVSPFCSFERTKLMVTFECPGRTGIITNALEGDKDQRNSSDSLKFKSASTSLLVSQSCESGYSELKTASESFTIVGLGQAAMYANATATPTIIGNIKAETKALSSEHFS